MRASNRSSIYIALFLGTNALLASGCASDEQPDAPEVAASVATYQADAVSAIANYEKRGRYTVKRLLNVGKGSIPGGVFSQLPVGPTASPNDPTAFTLYYPENAADGERFPLLTFGNGTFVNPTYYDVLIEHVASHGFVVIGANDSQVGNGKSMLKAVDWAIAQAGTAGSPIYGKLDVERVGAFGQSQGGTGTCNAGLDPRVDTIVPLSGIPFGSGEPFVSGVKIPVFFVNSAAEDTSNKSVLNVYNKVKVPAVYGVTAHGNHNSYGDAADDPGLPGLKADDAVESRAGITAWFEWQLKSKAELRSLFVGPGCGLCKGSTWKSIVSKGF